MIDRLCRWLCERYPDRVRIIDREGEPYLLRFYITTPRTAEDSDNELPERLGIYIHHFYMGDQDPDLHNHPWKWAMSMILSGTYFEERLEGTSIFTVIRRAWTFNFMTLKDFHRVTLLPDYDNRPIWTLFVTGKRVKRWGFMRRGTGEYVDAVEYIEGKK